MRITGKFSKRYYLRHIIVYFLVCCILFNTSPSAVLAGPEGAQVVNGQVSFQQSGYNTTITASDQSIINYSSFDIARPEIVQFIQPGSNASVLNRILSAEPTMIEGTLLANGRVFFVNPAGVMIGDSARINVNQLVASGLNISNSGFLNGQYEFVGGEGAVVNNGDISAESVYLVGKQVTNAGNIECPKGYVVMAAGDRVFLGEPGSKVIVEIGSPEPTEQTNSQPPGAFAEVTNEGTVEAAGGTIILAAAGDAFSKAIMTNIGTLSTSATEGDGGNISLEADNGQIDNTGSITAKSDLGIGGTVTANAGEVVNSGNVDVSGVQGGTVALDGTGRVGQFGTIRADGITGDGGNVNLWASDVVALGSDSLTTANAGVTGNGGEVIAFSPDTALFRNGAQVEAKGGSISGNGGFFELSGKEYVEVQGQIDLSVENGQDGSFLIDPYDLTIVNVDSPPEPADGDFTGAGGEWEPSQENSELDIDILEGFLGTADVTLSTEEVPYQFTQNGDISFDAGRFVTSSSGHDLTVVAAGDIIFNPGNGIDFDAGGGVSLSNVYNTGGIFFADTSSDSILTTGGGDIQMLAGSGGITVGNLITNMPSGQEGRVGDP
ncbi:MAG: two-partner secretion domain-containing protein, partial [Planctomycetota bacterium]